MLFDSAEWHRSYAILRNTNEGFNGYVKDPAHEALDDAGRRRLNGVAAQSILTALLLLAANARKIRVFLDEAALRRTDPAQVRPRPRGDAVRDRCRPGGHRRWPTGATPARTHPCSPKARSALSENPPSDASARPEFRERPPPTLVRCSKLAAPCWVFESWCVSGARRLSRWVCETFLMQLCRSGHPSCVGTPE